MKFNIATPNENFIYREVSEDNNIEIGIYPVMFGFRVRGGLNGDFFCPIDYCAGDKQEFIELLFTMVKEILMRYDSTENSENPFSVFPEQHRKPFFLDLENFPKLLNFFENIDSLEIQKLPNLNTLKATYFANLL